MNEIVVAIIGSGALSTFISVMAARKNARIEAQQNIEDGLASLLLAEIERRGEKYLDRGEISTDDYAKFNGIYQSYKKLGGNGYADRIKEAVDELPLVK